VWLRVTKSVWRLFMSAEGRLNKARRTRTDVAQIFTALATEQLGAREILDRPPACLSRIRVYDVLRRFPHLNRDGAETVLLKAKVWPLTPIGQLTEAERKRILLTLPPRVKR
jgi:hypothetical protein